MKKRLKELEEARKKALSSGEGEKADLQHGQGKLTARERIETLLDSGSFSRLNMLIGHLDGRPGDGIITGSGSIEGRKVFVYAQDPAVKAGSIGREHGCMMYRAVERALEMRTPLIGLHDSPGARLPSPEDMELLGRQRRSFFSQISEKHGGSVFFPNTEASGVIPQISGILGSCGGISVYSPALHDFIFMVNKTSHMFITGPQVVKSAIGEDITKEDLGGSRVHAQKSGVCDFRYANEQTCLREIRRLLGFLPSNCDEMPPVVNTGDDPARECDGLLEIVPTDPNKPYDMHKVIHELLDNGDFMEVKREFAGEIIVGFGRMDGKSIGIVANQPMTRAGCLTLDSSDKQARFIRFCDCFNIPILLLVDTPAYMPGSTQEHAGIIRHGAKVLYALCEASVPRISLVLRKAYGGGNLGMGVLPGLGTDLVLYWPIVETGILGAQQSVTLLFGSIPREKFAEKLEQYRETYANPIYDVSSNLGVDDVIAPGETRRYLIRALKDLEGKKVQRISKKHGNIPL
ncbi:MAG: acyl-CoA carboxylase subunit beta [Desulfatiglans sp.]|nr:acyl-CoA carboxylase subunit beta [Thermodesulfobacteriota bacterium]MEE4353551.1 acyl-CoA carboxylase subunit beta [Desulfatiglans sp.]